MLPLLPVFPVFPLLRNLNWTPSRVKVLQVTLDWTQPETSNNNVISLGMSSDTQQQLTDKLVERTNQENHNQRRNIEPVKVFASVLFLPKHSQ